MKERTKKVLLVFGCTAMLLMVLAFTTGGGLSAIGGLPGDNSSSSEGASSSIALGSGVSPHTVLSSIFILGLAGLGLMILGSGETAPRRPYR